MYKMHFKKFQDAKNEEHEMTKKQIKELREDFYKHQSETKDTVKREIHELKIPIVRQKHSGKLL
jgi:hypothetical protein